MQDNEWIDPMDILGWLTDNTGSSMELGEILQPLRVGIVSPSATASALMDNPTFFRTVQGDATTAMAIVKLCKTLGFSYLQVIFTNKCTAKPVK
jgi:ABC-type branched-subunit amino acid transport system substrate-binding protein